MAVRNVNATPQSCTDEIDVTWDNDRNAVYMAVDRVMVNGPTNNAQPRIRIRNSRQPLRDTTVVSGNTYIYNVRNWDSRMRSIQGAQSNSAFAGAHIEGSGIGFEVTLQKTNAGRH